MRASQRKHRAKFPREFQGRYLKRAYGISLAEYDALHEGQGGVCAICGRPETDISQSGKPRNLAVDHEHSTNAVRGLLCAKCNKGLGLFDDRDDLLSAAAQYLLRYKSALRNTA